MDEELTRKAAGRGTDGRSGRPGSGENRAAELLWGAPRRPTRGPKPSLTLDRIAAAGVHVADAEGLAAVSMQQVAAQLGVTKMALYRYVPGKTELVALMVDTAIGEVTPATGEPAGWRAALTDWAHTLYATLGRHPWLVDALVGPRAMGPNELTWIEDALRALDGSGLSGAERMDAVALLSGHIRDIARHARASGPAGSPEEQILGYLTDVLHDHPDRYPALAAALASPTGPQDRDQALEFGLERILDGLSALIASRRAG